MNLARVTLFAIFCIGMTVSATPARSQPAPSVPSTVIALFGADDLKGKLPGGAACWLRYVSDDESLTATTAQLEGVYPGLLRLWSDNQRFEPSDPACPATSPTYAVDIKRHNLWKIAYDGNGKDQRVTLASIKLEDWLAKVPSRVDKLIYFQDRLTSVDPVATAVPTCKTACSNYHNYLLGEYSSFVSNLVMLTGLSPTTLTPLAVLARSGRNAPVQIGPGAALASWCQSNLNLSYISSSGKSASTDWTLQCVPSPGTDALTIYIARPMRFFQLPTSCRKVQFVAANYQTDLTSGKSKSGAILTYLDDPQAKSSSIPEFKAEGCTQATSSYTVTMALKVSDINVSASPDAPPVDELCFTSAQLDRLVKPIQTTTYDAEGSMKDTAIMLRLNSTPSALLSFVQRPLSAHYNCTYGGKWTYDGGTDKLQLSGYHSVSCAPADDSATPEGVIRLLKVLSPLDKCL